jgi:hypothetical protein
MLEDAQYSGPIIFTVIGYWGGPLSRILDKYTQNTSNLEKFQS